MIISPEQDIPDVSNRAHVKDVWDRARLLWCRSIAYLDPIVLVGLPGSGKSTWAQANDKPSAVIFDGCFARPSARAQVLRPCAKAGRLVVIMWIDTPLEVCIARDAARRRPVGAGVIRTMAHDIAAHPPRTTHGVRVARGGPPP